MDESLVDIDAIADSFGDEQVGTSKDSFYDTLPSGKETVAPQPREFFDVGSSGSGGSWFSSRAIDSLLLDQSSTPPRSSHLN